MDSSQLEKDMISQPELWKLSLLVGRDRLDVALTPPVAREEIIIRGYPISASINGDHLHAIQDIIYENPLLFSDFKRVDCVIDNVAQILLPAALTADQIADAFNALTDTEQTDGNPTADDIETFPTGNPDCRIALCQHRDIRDFFTRTFYNVRFDSRQASLMRYFNSLVDLPRQPIFFAVMRRNRLTLIATNDHNPMMANDFTYSKPIDVAYYLMACASTLGIDPSSLQVFVSATETAEPQSEIIETIKRFIAQTAPLPFPMLRYRASKATIQAPLELIIRPLCE